MRLVRRILTTLMAAALWCGAALGDMGPEGGGGGGNTEIMPGWRGTLRQEHGVPIAPTIPNVDKAKEIGREDGNRLRTQ